MKTMKKFLCSTLALVGVCAFSGGLAFVASADTTTQIEANAFEMQDGASVRKDEPAGIRFTALVGENVYNEVSTDPNKDFGMFIVPDSYMDDYEEYIVSNSNYEGKYYEYFSEQKKMIDFTYTPDQLTEKYGGYLMRGALSNVLFENLTREFVGVAYIKTTTGNDISYRYADFNRVDNARSISYVASAAINDGEGNDALNSYLAKSAYKFMGVTYNKDTEKYVSGVNAYGALENIEAISPERVYALPSPTLVLTIDNAASVTSQNLSCLSVEYTSDKPDIVSVDDKGVVTALKEGTATITAKVGNYTSTRKVKAVFSDYYEFAADEFVETTSADAYSSVSGVKYGKTGTYAFTGNNGDSEINALNTTHVGESADYEDPTAVRANLNAKGYKYIAMNFALSSGASIQVVGGSIYGTLGMIFTDGSALAYAGEVESTIQAPYFHVYKNGAEVKVGDTIEANVWYTVVVELLLDPTGSSQANIEDESSTVGFGVGNDKPVYIAGGRYYTNDSFKDDYIYNYVEYGADEFVDTKGVGGYAAVDDRVFGRSNVYKFESAAGWTYEIGALHTVYTSNDSIYENSSQVAENATAHGWQYIAIDFALLENNTMNLVNTIPNPDEPKKPATGGLVLQDGAAPTYRTPIDTEEERGWYKIYSAGKEITIGGTEKLAYGVWYTVVVKLLMGPELTDHFRNVGFGGTRGNIYISGVRYYVNDKFTKDYIYNYVEYGADEFVDTKNGVGGYAAVDGRVFGRSNVYKFESTIDWTYEIGALHTVYASTAKDRIYEYSSQVVENATAHGWQYIAIDFALGANDTMNLVNTIPDGTGTTTGGLVLQDGAAPRYRDSIDTEEERGWYKIYSEGKEIVIGGEEKLAYGVWYTVVVKLLMGPELEGHYRNVGFGGAAAGNIYISGVRYYVNDNFKTKYTTLEDYYEYGAEEVIDVKGNDAYSAASEEIYGKDNVYMFTPGKNWENQIDVRKTTHLGYDKDSGAFYSQAKDVRASLNEKGIQYVAVEFALAPDAAVSLLGIIPYTGSNESVIGGLNFAVGSALAYRSTVDTPEKEAYFTVYANGKEVAIGDTIEAGVWYTVVVKLQLDVNQAKDGVDTYVNVGFGATGSGVTYISGVRYYTNDSYKTDYASYSEEESE